MTAPAASSRSTAALVSRGTKSAEAREPTALVHAGEPVRVLDRERDAAQRPALAARQRGVGCRGGAPRAVVEPDGERVERRLRSSVGAVEHRLERLDGGQLAPRERGAKVERGKVADVHGLSLRAPCAGGHREPHKARLRIRDGSCGTPQAARCAGASRSRPLAMPSASSAISSSPTSAAARRRCPCRAARTSRPASRQREPPARDGAGSAAQRLASSSTAPSRPSPARTSATSGCSRERAQRVAASGPSSVAPALDQPVALVDVERRERRGAAGRVAGVGRAVAQHGRARLAREERLGDVRRDDHRAERQRAAGDALRERDQVRLARPASGRSRARCRGGRRRRSRSRRRTARRARGRRRRRPRGSPSGGSRTPPAPITGSQKNAGDALGAEALDLRLERVDAVVRHDARRRARAGPSRRGWPRSRRARAEAVRAVVAVLAGDQVHALGLRRVSWKCARASFAAVSIASPPPEPRKTRAPGIGASAASRSAQLERRAVREVAEVE